MTVVLWTCLEAIDVGSDVEKAILLGLIYVLEKELVQLVEGSIDNYFFDSLKVLYLLDLIFQ